MASIELKNVGIEFPVYNNRGRSFKNTVLSSMVGGRIRRDNGGTVVKALEGVSLSLKPGDRCALLGHNGAGKSTLLKVMAGIYAPTAGVVSLQGKVMPMFDPGLGISPESTGWENIRTRGILLGLTDLEIAALSDEVAEISGLGDFLNMPVRTYSSGMRMRLAFCVSTAVKPEILLLDEAVVVGDSAFLRLANKRISELVADSNILVLASHSRDILRKLCNMGVLVNGGRAEKFEDLDKLFKEYDTISREPRK